MDMLSICAALIGGTLIGLASAILWLGNGRLAGISGIFGYSLLPSGKTVWRAVFLLALVAGGFITSMLLSGSPFEAVINQSPTLVGNPFWIAVAGLLVGLGTKIGNGCTSGHGVCGLARFSTRSLVAVIVFFATAILTVAIVGVPA